MTGQPKKSRRIRREATPAERAKYAALRRKLDSERNEIVEKGRRIKARHDAVLGPVVEALSALRRQREAQGLSLTDVEKRSGIGRAALSRLETDPDVNPTIATLNRYAAALGKRLVLVLENEEREK